MNHRVERRHFPDVRHSDFQTVREIQHTRRIKVTTFTLHDEHQRENRRTHHRVLREVAINFSFYRRRKCSGFNAERNRLRQWSDFYELRTHSYSATDSHGLTQT